MIRWRSVFLSFAIGAVVAIVVGMTIRLADPCAAPGIEQTKFGTREICEVVRAKQAEGLELHDCVKQDGHTYCIMIDRPKGRSDADQP